MNPTLKALAALLAYPEKEILVLLPEIAGVLRADRALAPSLRARLLGMARELAQSDPVEMQERYVGLFDRTRSLALHLFEHVHGDSRERGPAMVDLLGIYKSKGLEPEGNELPDHLPLYLEYTAMLDEASAKAALGDVAHIIGAIRDRLTQRASPYAAVFDAVLALAGIEVAVTAVGDIAEEDLEALDREWEEAAITFGPESDTAQSCNRAQEMLQRMNAA